MTQMPTEGGSYIRDPETGALTKTPADGPTPDAEMPTATKPQEPVKKGGK